MLEVVRIYTSSPLRNFSYLVHQSDTQETLCIDPFESSQISHALSAKGWDLQYILNTHEHHDHISGNEGLIREFGAEVLAHPNAMSRIPGATRSLQEKERLLSNLDSSSYLEIFYTPGHTFAHLCLLQMEKEIPHAVFTGDTVFNSGVGNCKNGGDPETLYNTIRERFETLPGSVRLYPGHDYFKNNLRFSLHIDPANQAAKTALSRVESLKENEEFWTTSFSEERTFSPFFLAFHPEEDLVRGIKKSIGNESIPSDPKSLFLALRSLRDKW
ncbi:hydroxyacylglutathione hydrolase [Leptospira langatensis]|uniref:hydroxyacylglutathione hydrolase n=1 Tax=Leptospira langatensis TaxID=2484983 RepID=A0A5F1ZZW4_9LEPT|nr:hydroxyacylglutathione hydrolase family protein [Leptospira langatensis]TGK04077.1 hydroxyacylglutathione hydrolase [Leptospira langatensis]TGL43557.1 hydroxyacylglutathione hydrolase [Leptospira langatensis]